VSNVLGIIIGIVAVIVGLVLIVAWWASFIVVLKGIIPILLILIGAAALFYFMSEVKSKIAEGPNPSFPEGKKGE